MAEEIVISGISGRFPESDNVDEFSEKLFAKVDLSTEIRRWEPGLYGLPKIMGQLKNPTKFDNVFFGVNNKQAHILSPQMRILLELTHEAIIDAGCNPDALRGRNIGVFIGNCAIDSEDYVYNNPKKVADYAVYDGFRAMLSNRISFSFDFKGPSVTVDTGCSSGAFAIYDAVCALRNGECESAIVGAANLCLNPAVSLKMRNLNAINADGVCKSFDASSDGYGRSEGIVVIYLQKESVARRNYASIVHVKSNTDGYKHEGLLFPSSEMQSRLMQDVYKECKISPLKVNYVEAHGTGTLVGDPVEVAAIADVFCPGREKPLLIGSVKSNMGHSEGAAGLCSLTKLIISMEKGLVPPNIRYSSPNPNIKSLVEGKVKIVTEPTPLEGDYAALNAFGIGGTNGHVLLKKNTIERKPTPIEGMSMPQLALYSGRTEEAVQYLFDYLENKRPAREFFSLLHKSVYSSALAKPYRGYKLLGKDQDVSEIKKLKVEGRPVWYIFSSMGSQWPRMAEELMHLEVFGKSIKKSVELLKPYGLDLYDLLTREWDIDPNKRSIIPAFVCITAMQIALVDVLNAVGITPDGMVGHSLGELGCAYADGSFTDEQTLLCSYFRGKSTEDANLIVGAMAAIGLTWKEIDQLLPKDVFLACHNAEDSVTISGPKNSVKMFVETLKDKNIFVRKVDCFGYAYHSKYILPVAEILQASMDKVIPSPKPRSSRWISSSFPEDEWGKPESKLASSYYFVHNLVSPVLFREALLHVPKNAIVIEIGPHHLLQAILKRGIGPDAEYIGLMKRNVDNRVHLLCSLGRLYTLGLNPNIEKIYPLLQFPVPRGIPMISPLMKWDHSESFFVARWDKTTNMAQMITEVNVGAENSPDKFILDHCIDGRYLYPATGLLVLVWKGLAEIKGKDITSLPVVFEKVVIHKATVLSKTAKTEFLVEITKAGGDFEISEGDSVVCTGRVCVKDSRHADIFTKMKRNDLKNLPLHQKDIYKEFKLRGYDYGPRFQNLIGANIEGNKGLLKWTGEWVSFLDAMLQLTILNSPDRALLLQTKIESVKIDPVFHKSILDQELPKDEGIPVIYDKQTQNVLSGGIELKNVQVSRAPRKKVKQVAVLEKCYFVPYHENSILSETDEETLRQYNYICGSLAKKILMQSGRNEDALFKHFNKLKEADDALIERYVKSSTDNHVLLNCLSGVIYLAESGEFEQHAKHFFRTYLFNRENDILYQPFLKENVLRSVMDVFLENSDSNTLKVAEFAKSTLPLSFTINEFFGRNSLFNVSYLIFHSKSELLDESNLLSENFELLSWDSKSSLSSDNLDLIVMKFLDRSKKDYKQILANAIPKLKSNGFLLLLERTRLTLAEMILSTLGKSPLSVLNEADLEDIFTDIKLDVICKKSDSLTSTLYLLRISSNETYVDTVIPIIEDNYEKWVDKLSRHMATTSQSSDSKRVWLVSEGAPNSGIIGLSYCLRKEPGGSIIRCVFTCKETSKFNAFSLKNPFYQEIARKNLTINVCCKGSWGSYRRFTLTEDNPGKHLGDAVHHKDFLKVETEHAYLNVMKRGDLSSFAWVDSPIKYAEHSDNRIFCQVYYAPLNFKDVMLASGKIPVEPLSGNFSSDDCSIGIEFSGRMKNGQRVMGLVPTKGLASSVIADPDLLWEVPEDWSLAEASTVPAAYSTAYYALIMRGHLRKGERVLIHSGSGGVGQAAIAVCLSLGCEVFTTVGSTPKKEFLKKRFSELRERNFCYSRDTSFKPYILNETNGEGVDVILNSLANEKLKASLDCLSQSGRFIEIGKYDMLKDTLLGMSMFLKNISFVGVMMDVLFEVPYYSVYRKEIKKLVIDGIANGTVKPLDTTLFGCDEAEQAFRFMASGKHIGKVVIKIKDEEPQKKIKPRPMKLEAISRIICNPDKTYVIIGGLGRFGIELCQWLVDRGARHIILTSRSGIKSGYQKLCLNNWKERNINVQVSKLNAVHMDEAKALLKVAVGIKPVAAIFNLALVLRDAIMENQTVEKFKEVCETKINSTINLDKISRGLCPKLEWFVCFSSIIAGLGNAGQANYGYANSVMERICERRQQEGYPGLAIQWGLIADAGTTETKMGNKEYLVVTGTIPQHISSCLTALEKFLLRQHPVVSSYVPFEPSEIVNYKDGKLNVLASIGHMFGIKDMSAMNEEISLLELGIDSLLGLEIKQYLERECSLVLSTNELRQLKVKDLKTIEQSTNEENANETFKSETENTLDPTFDLDVTFAGRIASLTGNQLCPTKAIVAMNSVKTGIPLFIVHALEGTVEVLSSMAQLLNVPVYGIQYTPDAPTESMEHLAAWYWKRIMTLKVGNIISLAGYSFGTAVVFEMCLQAERDPQKYSKVLNLIMLEGSPALASAYPKFHHSKSMIEFEAQALAAYVLRYTEINILEFKKELLGLPSFDDRVDKCAAKIIANYNNLKTEDLTLALKLYYKRLLMSLKFAPNQTIKKEVTLIKASQALSLAKNFSESYDLEKVCLGKITVHTVRGNHITFLLEKGAKETSIILNDIFCQEF